MPSLESLIPEIAAYQQAQNQGQRQQLGQLQQVGALQGILQKQQAMQEQEQAKALITQVAQQAGGDPARMVPLLMQQGPLGIKLAQGMAPLIPKAAEPYTLSPGAQRFGPDNKVLASVPPTPSKPESEPEFVRLQNAAQKYPVGHPLRVQIEARLKMLQERPAGVTVNMPASSDTVKGEDGRFYKFRVGKDGKAEAIPIADAQGNPLRPPETPSEKKAEGNAAEDASTLEGARKRVAKMAELIKGGSRTGSVVGPLGAAGRVVETVEGMVDPSAATPSLDYENEKTLLLSQVRKLVEKDPNLSNQERETLTRTLGGGTLQTPGSAMRTLKNVLDYVESKQRTGATRSAGMAQQVQAAGWAYEPNKYDYRVVDGKVQRKKK